MIKRLAHRILSTLLALLLIATQVAANDWLINSYRFAAAPTGITLVGTASGSNEAGTSLTVTMPGGVQQDDVVYAVACASTSATDMDMTVSTSGYTELADVFQTDTDAANLGVFRKVQGASPDASVTFGGTANSGQGLVGILYVLRGVDTGSPEDTTAVTAVAPNDATPDPPSITTVAANAWVVAVGCSTEGIDLSPTAPTNYGDLVELQNPSGGRPASNMVASRKIASPGAENPDVFGGVSGTTADSWAAASIAVRPAGSGICSSALTIAEVDGASTTSSGTTLATSGTVTASVGDMLVAIISADNNGTSGVSSISAPSTVGGNTWTNQVTINRTPGAAAADGATVAFYTSTITSALSSATITANFSPATAAKAVSITRVQPSAGCLVAIAGVDSIGVSGSLASPTYTTPSITSGDTVIAGLAVEDRFNTSAGDSDTTNGSWSTLVARFADTGTATTSMGLAEQHKTVTATGTQSWTVTGPGAARDYVATSITLRAASSQPAVVEYLGTANTTTDGTSATFTAQPFGADIPSRQIIVVAGSEGTATRTISSITIGGNAASQVGQVSSGTGTVAGMFAGTASGTSGNIVVTLNGTGVRYIIGIYRVTYAATSTSDMKTSTAADPTASMTVPANGIGIGAAYCNTTANSATWSVFTEDFDVNTAGEQAALTGASIESVAGISGTVLANYATAGTSAGVFATWAPQ